MHLLFALGYGYEAALSSRILYLCVCDVEHKSLGIASIN